VADPGRSLWAACHLLDRQVVDRHGVPVAKVDDLELTPSDDADGLPILTDILCGQAALAGRFDRRLGRALEGLRRVIDPTDEPGPARIGFGVVTTIGPEIGLSVDGEELAVTVVDRWLAEHVLSHLPGSGAGRRSKDRG
jgi:hypothetical protein